MKLLILRSETHKGGLRFAGAQHAVPLQAAPNLSMGGERPNDPYTQEFGGLYADRVIGNLAAPAGFCTACGPDCVECRATYRRRFADNIAEIIAFPSVLPHLLETPWDYVPEQIPPHDVVLAINIHEQILVEMLKRCVERGAMGIVVPLEAGHWISPAAREQAREICRGRRVEIAFPKPFCSFDPPAASLLAEFRRHFHIGKPEVELRVEAGRIEEALVTVSAACGATYYVARWLAGRRVDDDLEHEVVSKRLHSYPCTASMSWDDELGETPLHVAASAHEEIIAPLRAKAAHLVEPCVVMSPLGRMIAKPVPVRENMENIERAKRAILNALDRGEAVTLRNVRTKWKITPAAIDSALLILKQEGKIRTAGGKISKV